MASNKLPKTAIAVRNFLRHHAQDGCITISRSQLARRVGCSEFGARLSLRRLESAGIIDVKHSVEMNGRVLSNTYHLRSEG